MSTATKTPLWLATVIAALGLVVAGGALAWACTQRASIELDPANGRAGGTTTVHGKHFVEGEVDIYWDSATASNHLATVAEEETYETTDGVGFSKTVTIPEDARKGDHSIVARSQTDAGGSQYQAPAAFNVTQSNESGDPSQDTSGDPSQDSSGDPSQDSSGDAPQDTSAPSTDPNNEPAQNTEPSPSPSGPTSQSASGAGSRDERGEAAGSSSMPGLGSGEDQARSEPTNEPTPDQSQPQAPAEDPAENSQSVGEAPQPAPQNQPATDGRDQVGASTPDQSAPAAPAPAPEPSDEGQTAGAEADPAPAPTDQPATTESGEQVFEGSVGPSESTDDSGRAEEPLADGEAQQADPRAAESEGEHPSAPSENTASGDLWSGLEADEAPSLTPTPGEAAESDPNGGMAGALMAGVALLALGLTGLLATVGAAAVRRRRLATATTTWAQR